MREFIEEIGTNGKPTGHLLFGDVAIRTLRAERDALAARVVGLSEQHARDSAELRALCKQRDAYKFGGIETASALRRELDDAESRATRAEAALKDAGAWRPIAEAPDSDDLIWLRRGDNIDGPRAIQSDDCDYYDYFAPCEAPRWT